MNAVHRYKHRGKNMAKLFRDTVLKQVLFCTRRNPFRKPQATPPIGYGCSLRFGTQNVQGMAEILKHQAALQLCRDYFLEVLFLTETHSKSYYSFHSEGYMFVVNGNSRDRWSGVTAVIAPNILPYVKNIIQHTSRILEIVISARAGDVHLIGVYAPHDKSEVEIKKTPFWDRLLEVVSTIPGPEPYYVVGDFNVRLQGRKSDETDFIGPHVYGKGHLFANTRENSNRSLYTALLKSQGAVDAFSYKQPNLLKQITYRDKHAPPQSWDQFIHDPLAWLQLWDKFQSLPLPGDDQLSIVAEIRSYLEADTLPSLLSYKPQVDPYRFQSLDRVVTLKKWLPTLRTVTSKLNTGFPSDHYLVMASVKVKLAARLTLPPRKPKLDYTAKSYAASRYNAQLRKQLNSTDTAPHNAANASLTQSIQIYTDGSGSSGRCSSTTPAGWGFVVVNGDEVIHEARGPVSTHVDSAYYLGATVGSNNTGELSAWMEAALYLLGSPDTMPSSVTFCYDSQWAANMVRGKFRVKRNRTLVSASKQILDVLAKRTTVKWQWIKGHSGDAYNDHADSLAEAGKADGQRVGGRDITAHFYTPATMPREITPPQTNLTIDEISQQLAQAMKTAEELTFSKLEHAPRTPWITPELASALQLVKDKRKNHDPQAEVEYRRLKSWARKIKRDWTREQLCTANAQSSTSLWHSTRRLKKGFRERKTRLKRDGRPVPWSQTHQVFSEYLSQTQWAPSQVSDEEIQLLADSEQIFPPSLENPSQFTMEELEQVIAGLKRGKAPGPDEVRAELILFLDYWGQNQLLRLLNRCFESKTVPDSWKEAFVVSIYKGKGSDSDPANYRPISLLNTFYKIYAALLQKRLAISHDGKLRSTQYGFRSRRSTNDPLFILRRAQDLSIKTGTPLCLLFLDWKMAFDKLDHRSMATALKRIGVHRHYVDIISDLYTQQTFTIRGTNGESVTATPHTGIRQGCPLSPYLFIMVMSVLFHDVDQRLLTAGIPTNTWSVGKPVYDLEYADDTLLISVTPPQMEQFLKYVQVEASLYGMQLNLTKTEILSGPGDQTPIYFVDGTTVNRVEQAKYLGTQVTWSAPTKCAIDARKSLAFSMYMKLQPLWRSKLNWKTKVRIFQATIIPRLLYGLDTLTLEMKHLKTIDAWYFQHLRRCMGIKASYYSRITNDRVWKLAGKPETPSQVLTSAQLSQLSKILITPPDDPMHHVVFSPGVKDRVKYTKGLRRGHPQRYWLELNTEIALPVLKAYAEYNALEYRYDILGIRQMLNNSPGFRKYLETAPTRQKGLLARHVKALGCAWQP